MIVSRVKPFKDWGIPAPVVGGLIILAAEFIFRLYLLILLNSVCIKVDYIGAVMCAGFICMGVGSGCNAVADEELLDIANPLFMSIVGSFIGNL